MINHMFVLVYYLFIALSVSSSFFTQDDFRVEVYSVYRIPDEPTITLGECNEDFKDVCCFGGSDSSCPCSTWLRPHVGLAEASEVWLWDPSTEPARRSADVHGPPFTGHQVLFPSATIYEQKESLFTAWQLPQDTSGYF